MLIDTRMEFTYNEFRLIEHVCHITMIWIGFECIVEQSNQEECKDGDENDTFLVEIFS